MANRAKKSGIGADIERKREAEFDKASNTVDAVRLWINATMGADITPISTSDHREIHRALADGVILCQLVNKLIAAQGGGNKPVSFKKKCPSPFVARGNIEAFNNGCVVYGLSKEDTFQTDDLVEGSKAKLLNVILNIHSLGMKANKNNFEVMYTGTETPILED